MEKVSLGESSPPVGRPACTTRCSRQQTMLFSLVNFFLLLSRFKHCYLKEVSPSKLCRMGRSIHHPNDPALVSSALWRRPHPSYCRGFGSKPHGASPSSACKGCVPGTAREGIFKQTGENIVELSASPEASPLAPRGEGESEGEPSSHCATDLPPARAGMSQTLACSASHSYSEKHL